MAAADDRLICGLARQFAPSVIVRIAPQDPLPHANATPCHPWMPMPASTSSWSRGLMPRRVWNASKRGRPPVTQSVASPPTFSPTCKDPRFALAGPAHRRTARRT